MAKRREIRNSTAEFLIFQIEGKSQGVEVFYKDKTVWCTQKAMGTLFDCTVDNIWLHLKNIYESGELKKEGTFEEFSVVRREGNRKTLGLVHVSLENLEDKGSWGVKNDV